MQMIIIIGGGVGLSFNFWYINYILLYLNHMKKIASAVFSCGFFIA